MKISFFKKIFFRIVKQIQINSPKNIILDKTSQICQNSILNASKGTIFLGKNTRIGNSTELVSAENKKLIVKDYSTIYSNCKLLGNIEIERYCTLATNIYMSSGNHYAFNQPELLVKIQDQIVFSNQEGRNDHNKKIHIHEDVWIGNGVFITSGITIGRGAVIGSSAVLTKDVEPYSVMVGIPARKIKSRLNYNPPFELTCTDIQTHPYFYNGFNHYNLPETTKEKGFQLFERGTLHLNNQVKTLSFHGYSLSDLELEIKLNNNVFIEKITKGEFNFKLNNELTPEGRFLEVTLTSNSKNSLYLKHVKCN